MKYFLIFILCLPFILSGQSATTWEYNEKYQLQTLIEFSDTPLKRVTQFTYDAQGCISKVIKPDGVIIFYTFDTLNRLYELRSSDNSVHYIYHYDSAGNVLCIKNLISKNETYLERNEAGELIQHRQENGLTLSYLRPNAYTYIVVLPDSSSIVYRFQEKTLTSIERNNQQGTLVYTHLFCKNDACNCSQKGDEQQMSFANDSKVWKEKIDIESFNENNHIEFLELTDPLGTESFQYGYDTQQQLTSWTCGNCIFEFVYDPQGNRIQKNQEHYQVDDCNQTIRQKDVIYTYDQNGNMSSRTDFNGTVIFKYDALDRLAEIQKEKETKILYTYDGFHRRQTKTFYSWNSEKEIWVLQNKDDFLYFGNEEIGLFNSEGIQDLRILCDKKTKIIELPSGVYSAIQDHQGSIRCLIDIESGKVKEYYRYSPFGEEQIYYETKQIIPKEAVNRWRFSGKSYDSETGFIYFGFRYYSPELGKWTTPDPTGFRDGQNRYMFARNNPVNNFDPYGLFSVPLIMGKIEQVYHSLQETFQEYKRTHNSSCSFDQHMKDFVESLVGKGLFSLSSFHSEPRNHAVISGNTKTQKRITFINGIMNSSTDMERYAKNISHWHEPSGKSVTYVYRGTGGWSRDIIKSILIKLGYISEDARDLALIWKNIIDEIGKDGEIIHWAHSIGGTETLRARNLLTPEEQKMINVIALGSPSIIPNEGFKNVVNYISYRDGVGTLLDPIGFLHAFFFKPDYVDFKGSLFDGYPLVDHVFDVYMRYLEKVLENPEEYDGEIDWGN